MTVGDLAHSERATGPLPFDTSRAHQARVYDYLLGGKDNYAADRAVADALAARYPGAAFTARANRAFLGRAVRYLAGEAGIRQFLDVGTGIPTAGNLHEVAQAVAPETRVVYVDYDPVVLAHSRALLDSSEAGATRYVEADMRDTATVLSGAAGLLDFSRPVAVTMLALLHAIPDSDDPYGIVATFMGAVPSGSYLAISLVASDLAEKDMMRNLTDTWNSGSQQHLTLRSRDQVARFFDGLELIEPGLVRVEQWRPEPGASGDVKSVGLCAVARKP